jgi:hypothetical protein
VDLEWDWVEHSVVSDRENSGHYPLSCDDLYTRSLADRQQCSRGKSYLSPQGRHDTDEVKYVTATLYGVTPQKSIV